CEADIIALVLNADAPWSPFSPGFTMSMNRPVIGIVTKADLASVAQLSLVKCWLREAGARNVLVTSAINNIGVAELFALLHTKEGCR
ncbi:propanediol utilization protein, partial [Escherichia coli]|nr:propanediol utilization protein [Escherichia coli]